MAHTAPQSVISAPGYSGSKSSGFSSVEGSCGGEESKPERELGEPGSEIEFGEPTSENEIGDPRPVGEGGGGSKPENEFGEPRSKPVSEFGEPNLIGESGGEPKLESEFGDHRSAAESEFGLVEVGEEPEQPGTGTGTIVGLGGFWREDSCLERSVTLNVLKSAVVGVCLFRRHNVDLGIGAVESLRYLLYCPLVLTGPSPGEEDIATGSSTITTCVTLHCVHQLETVPCASIRSVVYILRACAIIII